MAEEHDDDSPWLVILGGLVCLLAAYYLHDIFGELESGQRESVQEGWVFMLLYKNLGPGLTVFLVGAVGASLTWSGVRRVVGSWREGPGLRRDRKKHLGFAALCLIGAAFCLSLAGGPWDPSRLKTVTGAVSDYREVRGDGSACFVINLADVAESFELCSTSYRNFQQAAFEREIRKGASLQMQVVDEIKKNKTTGETKYWVQDIRSSHGRVYLDLAEIQKSRAQEHTLGIVAALILAAGAIWHVWNAVIKG